MVVEKFRRESAVMAVVGFALASVSLPASAQLEEIVVSARKQEERAQDIPI